MNLENEKELDAFLKQLTKDIPLEEPHDHFTEKVLGKIELAGSTGRQSVNTPLFTRGNWVMIGLMAIILLVIGSRYQEPGTILPDFLSFFTDLSKADFTAKLPGIASSDILVFSLLAMISCLAVQIAWLKKSWEKKRVLF
jgi:hypothetical protein